MKHREDSSVPLSCVHNRNKNFISRHFNTLRNFTPARAGNLRVRYGQESRGIPVEPGSRRAKVLESLSVLAKSLGPAVGAKRGSGARIKFFGVAGSLCGSGWISRLP